MVVSRRATLIGAAGLALTAGWRGPARAQTADLEFGPWVNAFSAKAAQRGISQQTYQSVMSSLVPNMKVFEFDKSQPETVQPIWRYLAQRVTDWKVNTGRMRLQEQADVLARVEQVYGVDRYHIAALWGMEIGLWQRDGEGARRRQPCHALAWGDARRRPTIGNMNCSMHLSSSIAAGRRTPK